MNDVDHHLFYLSTYTIEFGIGRTRVTCWLSRVNRITDLCDAGCMGTAHLVPHILKFLKKKVIENFSIFFFIAYSNELRGRQELGDFWHAYFITKRHTLEASISKNFFGKKKIEYTDPKRCYAWASHYVRRTFASLSLIDSTTRVGGFWNLLLASSSA